jgi:uncharacterized protein YcbK (DUF882 family)
MKNYEMTKRGFIKLAVTLGVAAGVTPLDGLFLPESAMAEGFVPLRLRNPHTDEKYDIQLFEGAEWNPTAILACNWMLRDWRQSKGQQVVSCDRKLFAALYVLQRKFAPDGYINVHSGYRSKATNAMLRQASIRRRGGVYEGTPAVNSQHINAKAVDFSIPNVTPLEACKYVQSLQLGGVGSYPTFTHMDTGSVRHWGAGL